MPLPLIFLGLGGLAVGLFAWSRKAAGQTYVDRNGIRWRVYYESLPGWWSAQTAGYGGMNPVGYQSREQAIENIEGNAAMRDPKTGGIL